MNQDHRFDNRSPDQYRTPTPNNSKRTSFFADDNGLISPINQHSMKLRNNKKPGTNAGALSMEPVKKPPANTRRKRNPWTHDEDFCLKQLIKHAGLENVNSTRDTEYNFSHIAVSLGTNRTAKQCRDRWRNQLRTGIKKGAWTPEEEELIKDMYETFGPKWCTMAKLMTDRTDNDIKNKWNSMKRAHQRSNGTKSVETKPVVSTYTDNRNSVLGAINSPTFDPLATPDQHGMYGQADIDEMIERRDAAEALLNFHPVNENLELTPLQQDFSPLPFEFKTDKCAEM